MAVLFFCNMLLIVFSFLSMWKAFFAWFSLLFGGLLMAISFIMLKQAWAFFIFFFLFVGSLTVLFLYFISIQGKPIFIFFPMFICFMMTLFISYKKVSSVSCYSGYLVKIKMEPFMGMGLFFVVAIFVIKSLLSGSSFSFRPLCF